MPDVHARLSASGSKKWLNCPGSVRLEEKFTDSGSEYAAEGTTAHTLGELKICLAIKSITRPAYHKKVKQLEICDEMEEYTDGYRDYVLERFNALCSECADSRLMVEERIDLSDFVPDGFGTGDAVLVGGGVLEIIDLKYGKGVKVEAAENTQLMLYALGALTAYDWLYGIDIVRLHIYQPRLDNVDVWECTADSLREWGEWVKGRAALALEDDAPCCAGKYCDDNFCKARAVCRAYAEERQKLACLDFKRPAELDEDEIAEVLDQADALAKWAKAVSEYALDQALNHGVRYPGFKLVEGRSNRTYANEDKVISTLLENTSHTEADILTRKLKGITEMEKMLGKKKFNELLGGLVVKPQGKPVLVHAEDKRPEINSNENAKADFMEVINNDRS